MRCWNFVISGMYVFRSAPAKNPLSTPVMIATHAFVVGAEALPCLAQRLEVVHVGRVACLGPVDRDEDDVLGVLLVVDRHRERVPQT